MKPKSNRTNSKQTNLDSKNWLSVSLLLDEVNRLFYRMQFMEERVQKYVGLDAGERSIIFMLATEEATIPDLAFMRNVTRQRMHQLIKKLEKKKLVEGRINRRHLTSLKYQLTLHGKKILLQMIQREKKIYKNLFVSPDQKFTAASKTLREMREALERAIL